ncbi:hypothetical protein V6x_48130 [Gimesia chilikensis]|uniref:Intracellular proteinase inhibitor BsuPI domain-containing protein n=1 Tax=Gimesia chilikensis TaxID=2605989 RepID=A0A517WIL4_9PLAN|nr:hypothetical protein [Gimesia chilikensis]QDU05080.1 hypothetical protein V6x_48130 [Gimesia chilikensis]
MSQSAVFRILLLMSGLAVISSSSGERLARASVTQSPDPYWRQTLFRGDEPLHHIPEVISRRCEGDLIWVKVRNSGNTVLRYTSVGRSGIQLFQETDLSGRWQAANWDWCGMGKKSVLLKPGETVELKVDFWEQGIRERMLGHFRDVDYLHSAMIVLATENGEFD